MLRNTFHHIPGIGLKSESELWQAGINCWDDFRKPHTSNLQSSKIAKINQYIEESRQHCNNDGNPTYFSKLLPAKLHWRFFPEFMNSAVYLDIETTGLEEYRSEITTIALYDGKNIFHYTNGINLDDFKRDIKKYKLLITYNGKIFDIPFIERYFSIKLNQAHIDLRYILASLGFKGGLKGCETALGIDRKELSGIDGYFAVLLWNNYIKTHNPKALETLLAYNIEDVLNLDRLMITAYNMKIKETPFYDELRLDLRPTPENPFQPDPLTVDNIKSQYMYY